MTLTPDPGSFPGSVAVLPGGGQEVRERGPGRRVVRLGVVVDAQRYLAVPSGAADPVQPLVGVDRVDTVHRPGPAQPWYW